MEEREHIEEIDLQKYWLVLRRRWLPASLVFTTSLLLSVAYAVTRTPVYQAGGSLLFQTDSKTSLTGVAENLGQVETLSIQNNPLDTQAIIFRSDRIIQDVIEELDLRDETGEYLSSRAIRTNLTVTPVIGADVLNVAFLHTDPKLAATVVNQLMASYIANDIETNRAQAVAARSFIDEEIPEAKQDVEVAAEALRRFKDENNIVVLRKEAAVAVDIIGGLDRKINQANADLADINARSSSLSQQLGMNIEEAVDINALNQAPGVQQALTELQQIQTQLATEEARYTERHPVVANLQREESTAYDLLQERVAQVLGQTTDISPGQIQGGPLQQRLIADLVTANINQEALNNRIDALINTRNSYLEWNRTFPNLEKEQQRLENQLSAAQSAYETLLARKQEIELAENQQIGNASILQQAGIPSFSIGRSSKLYVMAGGVVGVFMGVAVAFLIDLIDRTVKTAKDAEALFGYPMLGVIPNSPPARNKTAMASGQDTLPLATKHLSAIVADAYQMLQANLKFISSDKTLKTYVVTSSVAGEGKSSVAAQLAMSISQSGRQVLLVDADMRSPDQHHLWSIVNGVGLSHVLVGEGTLEQALKPVADNLTLLTAGVTPPNPLALLDSDQMIGLLETLRNRYEAVIIDTPPLTGTADAAILGKIADGALLVVRPRTVDSPSAIAAKSLLERSGANILGLVANGVNVSVEHEEYVSAVNHTQKERVHATLSMSSSASKDHDN